MADLASVSTVVEGEKHHGHDENVAELLASASLSRQLGDLNNVVSNLGTSIANSNLINLQSLNELGQNNTAQMNQNQLQTLNSFNNLSTTLLTGFSSISQQFATATNQIIAQGTQLAAKMAEFCCEIKQKVSDEGQATRDLINSINLANVNVMLVDAKNQISNLQQTNAIFSALGVVPDSKSVK